MVPRIQFLFELEKVREIQLEDRERARNLVSVNVLEAGSVCIVRLALYHMFHFFVFHCYYAVKGALRRRRWSREPSSREGVDDDALQAMLQDSLLTEEIFLRKQRLLSLSEGYLESGSSSSTSSASRISLEVLQELRGHFPFHF